MIRNFFTSRPAPAPAPPIMYTLIGLERRPWPGESVVLGATVVSASENRCVEGDLRSGLLTQKSELPLAVNSQRPLARRGSSVRPFSTR